jgi:hypothetical protein
MGEVAASMWPRPVSERRTLFDIAADFHGADVGAGQDAVECGGELTAAFADEEPECGRTVIEVNQQIAGYWVVQAPVGWLVVPRMQR